MPLVTMRWSNFNAAHSKHGKPRYASGYVLTGPGNQPANTISTTINSNTNRLSNSGMSRRSILRDRLHDSSNGDTISAPKPSPIHHVKKIERNSPHCRGSPKHKLKLPIVALTSGASTAAYTTKISTSPTDSNVLLQRFDRCSRNQARTASSVFPVAIPTAEATEILVGKLAASAPMKTPGQTRPPKIRSAAIAIPVGGQT